MEELMSWLSTLGSTASILGLILTSITLIWVDTARRIIKRYLFIIRGPKLIEELENIGSDIVYLLQNFDSSDINLSRALARLRARIRSLQKKLESPENKQCKKLNRKLDKFIKGKKLSEPDIRSIYREAQGIIEGANEMLKDIRLGG
ncbi:hypothetical protein FJZ31_17360 [Candidatus Poribacteria bacterium]|nr:hypothetical protein [Candidatus Poribacteria bacterium]